MNSYPAVDMDSLEGVSTTMARDLVAFEVLAWLPWSKRQVISVS